MKTSFKENCKSLFKSCIDTRVLFERRKNSFLIPLLIFVLSIMMMCLPNFLLSYTSNNETLLQKLPGADVALETLFTSSIDCKVENEKLVCAEEQEPILVVVGSDIKYTIIANQDTISTDTNVVFGNPKDSDNLVMLLEDFVRIRYVQHDYVNEKVEKYEIVGYYSKLEGFDFKKISSELSSNPDLLDETIVDFVGKVHKSTLAVSLYTNFISAITSYTLFVLVTSLMIKSATLFKRKKGFTFYESLKISLTSSLTSLLISSVLLLLFGLNFSTIFGLIYLGRIVYIYIRYFFSSKNNIYKELYSSTGEERFKL